MKRVPTAVKSVSGGPSVALYQQSLGGKCLTDVVEPQTPALDYAGTAVRIVGAWDAKLGCRSRGFAENGEQTEKRWLYL